jgi:DNA topoisomerase IB
VSREAEVKRALERLPAEGRARHRGRHLAQRDPGALQSDDLVGDCFGLGDLRDIRVRRGSRRRRPCAARWAGRPSRSSRTASPSRWRGTSAAGKTLVFEFTGKSGIEHHVEVDDEPSSQAIESMRRRRGGTDRLLAFKNDGHWTDLDAGTVNDYLRERTGEDLTAKDFRTWHATVLAAAALAESDEPGTSKASRRRAVKAALAEVADFLGNSPAIARSSYVDPRVFDLYEDGVTIAAAGRQTAPRPGSPAGGAGASRAPTTG